MGRPDALVRPDVVVRKFGGSILSDSGSLAAAVHEVYREVREGRRVVAVVSASGGTTDQLDGLAGELAERPEPRAYAALLATGEARAAAALALAADAAGLPTALLPSHRCGIETRGPTTDAEPARFDPRPVLDGLERHPLVVVPGFVGQDPDGHPSLLGRGGSDLTAVVIAHGIGAESCRLIKGVDGWFVADPGLPGAVSLRYRSLHWEDAAARPAEVVQAKTVRFAARTRLPFEVGALGSVDPTRVGPWPTEVAASRASPPPLEVALLGVGAVGAALWRHLAGEPARFTVVAGLVRDAARSREPWIDRDRLITSAEEVLRHPRAVLVQMLPETSPARELLAAALERGQSVVTSNRTLVSHHGRDLAGLAAASGARLLFAAACGGATPELRAARPLAGRWPVAEAVLGDLMELERSRREVREEAPALAPPAPALAPAGEAAH